MIAAAIFSLAGIIAWQNVPTEHVDAPPNSDAGFFGLCAIICWVVAGLCASGVISTY